MTKKHLIQFAAEIKALMEQKDRDGALAVAFVVSSVAEKNNPVFDRARFYAACGL